MYWKILKKWRQLAEDYVFWIDFLVEERRKLGPVGGCEDLKVLSRNHKKVEISVKQKKIMLQNKSNVFGSQVGILMAEAARTLAKRKR